MTEDTGALPASRLSPRQKQCLRLAYERQTSKEIAQALGLSAGTVNTYITEAVAVLQARNRRHAAELLHAYEGGAATPEKVQSHIHGVPTASALPAPAEAGSGGLRRMLPVRPKGADGNDLGIFVRLSWPFIGGVILAIGFGMLAIGMRVLSDFFRAVLG